MALLMHVHLYLTSTNLCAVTHKCPECNILTLNAHIISIYCFNLHSFLYFGNSSAQKLIHPKTLMVKGLCAFLEPKNKCPECNALFALKPITLFSALIQYPKK